MYVLTALHIGMLVEVTTLGIASGLPVLSPLGMEVRSARARRRTLAAFH
jgi:hypothetical protein